MKNVNFRLLTFTQKWGGKANLILDELWHLKDFCYVLEQTYHFLYNLITATTKIDYLSDHSYAVIVYRIQSFA